MPSPDHSHKLLAAAVAALGVVLLAGVAVGSHRHTYAQYSDFADVHAAAKAGVWTPDPPSECGNLSNYSAIVYGTEGDDSIDGRHGAAQVVDLKHGGNREIVMGLGGNDDLRGDNGKDCIVGGPGDDILHGDNGKDILLGGPGTDQCTGGRAPDLILDCEGSVVAPDLRALDGTSTASPATTPETTPSAVRMTDPAAPTTHPAAPTTAAPTDSPATTPLPTDSATQ